MTRITADWLNSDAARTVCGVLTDAGYQAWYVGGCVRNALLGAPVADLDLSTDALPEDVMRLAGAAGLRAIPTGIAHGTVTIVAGNTPFEVTTFRKDIDTDGRRATVAFADNITDDAHRRDFTMNALYADPDGVVADPLGGLVDLKARHVRFIDDPEARIKEDYLRILRFFRFHAWYGDPNGGLDADGLAACAANGDGLGQLSRERVGSEIRKLLGAPDPAPAVAAMETAGVLMRVLPGANAASLAVLVHIEGQVGLAPDPIRRLALIGGEDVAMRLRLSKREAADLAVLRDGLGNGLPAEVLGYRHGGQALDVLALRAAMGGLELDPNLVAHARFGAEQVLPVSARDFMPDLQGAALGKAVKDAEERWIASGFTLTRDTLLGR
ncbi:CCA tRNA nucleotidyltransferase [Octadecabacter sp. SW4]|uniref:CCA tRNA nucleotidyltransferase n=1 Tax=Octadecabacter sp. SW4 TaxID=2602067 RepID=UPI0011C1E214|nr:CCA tRNA nucleotidyltransferase [Octadecabacter sp. SW4]QEE37077.1 CCA tRNA nucleotidyltransferase [Octadecabacter sp. SW4]